MTNSRVVPLELLQDLRDLASDAVEHHRQAFAGYKHERQERMDKVIRAVDKLLPAAPPFEANPSYGAGSVTQPEVFEEGQWWLTELDAAVADGTTDQKRAVAVVRNIMRQLAEQREPKP